MRSIQAELRPAIAMTTIDLSELAGPVNCISSSDHVVVRWAEESRLGVGRVWASSGVGAAACCSSGVWTLAMKRCQSCSRTSRSGPKARWNALKTRSARAPLGAGPSVGLGVRIAQQVDERQELPERRVRK